MTDRSTNGQSEAQHLARLNALGERLGAETVEYFGENELGKVWRCQWDLEGRIPTKLTIVERGDSVTVHLSLGIRVELKNDGDYTDRLRRIVSQTLYDRVKEIMLRFARKSASSNKVVESKPVVESSETPEP